MNGYNNYYSQNDPNQQRPSPTGGYTSGTGHTGWEFSNGAWRPTGGAQQPQGGQYIPQPPRKKAGKGGGRAVALILACALAGFGGGYAANQLTDTSGQTVVYQSVDAGTPAAGTASTERSVSDIAASAGASVVSITTENMVADFFTGGRVVSGAGSGVIISEDGYIITNNHVISGANNVIVTLPDGSEHTATFVGTDTTTDVAVIKINVSGLSPAIIGDSDALAVGDFCLAIGNPLGSLGGTVTDGIISGLDRELTIDGTSMNLLQMSAAVSPGNSGGGLFNNRGELVGVVNAKTTGSDSENLGFAIPINTAINVAGSLIENGYVSGRPALGVTILTVETQQEAEAMGLARPGVYLNTVEESGAAAAAGLQVGDRILSADGQEILTANDLPALIKAKEVGDQMLLVVERDGQELSITVTLGEMRS